MMDRIPPRGRARATAASISRAGSQSRFPGRAREPGHAGDSHPKGAEGPLQVKKSSTCAISSLVGTLASHAISKGIISRPTFRERSTSCHAARSRSLGLDVPVDALADFESIARVLGWNMMVRSPVNFASSGPRSRPRLVILPLSGASRPRPRPEAHRHRDGKGAMAADRESRRDARAQKHRPARSSRRAQPEPRCEILDPEARRDRGLQVKIFWSSSLTQGVTLQLSRDREAPSAPRQVEPESARRYFAEGRRRREIDPRIDVLDSMTARHSRPSSLHLAGAMRDAHAPRASAGRFQLYPVRTDG